MPVPKASFATEHTGDPSLDRIQAELKKLRSILANLPFASGALVEGISLTTSALRVSHRLGRKPQGFIVVKASPNGAVGLSAAQPSDPDVAVNLESSVSLTASVWFW